MAALSTRYRVIAPDLRGLGGTERAHGGYDVANVANDLPALLDVLAVERASVVGIDLGVQISFMLAMNEPERIERAALMEGLVGALPGAESFLSRGAPWWFGFHSVPGLAETIVQGREAPYLDYFFANGTFERRGVAAEARAAFIRAYSGAESIRCMCEHYRAMPESAAQIAAATRARRLATPTLAISGGVVGDALAGQLRAVTSNLLQASVERTAHIIPEDQPDALLALLEPFVNS